MSWDSYSVHAYAVEVQDLPLRDEIKALLNDEGVEGYQDVKDVLEDLRDGCLDSPVFDELENACWEIISGPGSCVYIGYPAVMPYEQPLMSQEEMDKEIYDTLVYLCGEKYAKENTPEKVFESWVE